MWIIVYLCVYVRVYIREWNWIPYGVESSASSKLGTTWELSCCTKKDVGISKEGAWERKKDGEAKKKKDGEAYANLL